MTAFVTERAFRALVANGGGTVTVRLQSWRPGDTVLVKPADRHGVPIDGRHAYFQIKQACTAPWAETWAGLTVEVVSLALRDGSQSPRQS